MILRAHVYGFEPWTINPGSEAEDRYSAFREVADQAYGLGAASDAESPSAAIRGVLASQMFADMERCLREPGDQYRAPDGVLYTLEDDQPKETR